ncbi:MAG: biotin--[acetyl-CoA-carboxylase] ligase [Ignavibacteria bacterium]
MFSFEDFDLKLDTNVIGRNFIYSEEVDSTNAVLLDPANDLNTDGSVLLAEKQSDGKGRKDRKWYSLKDHNLTFSVLLNRKFNERKINLINFAACLAISNSLENLYQLRINLKWPNDVLVAGEKIAGILLESTSKGNRINKLVVGIGLNVNQTAFQGTFRIPPTSVKKITGNDIPRERLLSEILNNFEELLERVHSNPQSILNDWKSRCRMLGEMVEVQDEDVSKTGLFEDVDEEGFMLLRLNNGKLERITVGDVSLR